MEYEALFFKRDKNNFEKIKASLIAVLSAKLTRLDQLDFNSSDSLEIDQISQIKRKVIAFSKSTGNMNSNWLFEISAILTLLSLIHFLEKEGDPSIYIL